MTVRTQIWIFVYLIYNPRKPCHLAPATRSKTMDYDFSMMQYFAFIFSPGTPSITIMIETSYDWILILLPDSRKVLSTMFIYYLAVYM